MKKLNFGCGNDIKENYINLDIVDLKGVDVVHDVNVTPYPFEENYFNEILCNDILEHVSLINVLRELHRILKTDGVLYIRVPHFTCRNNFSDPTHINRFSILTFDFFTVTHNRSYYFDFLFSKIIKRKITFPNLLKPVEFLVNINNWTLKMYESYFCYIFPAMNIEVTLKK